LAKEYAVSRAAVNAIIHKRTWKSVT
jgi:hypothetical protein